MNDDRRIDDRPDHDRLVEDHLPLADRIARRYGHRGVDADDLQQVARLALVKAARGFDPERGDFAPFAAATVRGEVKRYFRDLAWDVRPPRRVQELQARLSAEIDHDPRETDLTELAERLGVDPAEVREAAAARGCFTCDSIDAAEAAGHPFAVVDERLDLVEDWQAFRRLRRSLDDDACRLLTWRFLEGLTQQEIADRLGISQMQVSRRLSTLLTRLRTAAAA
ncbi:MAG: sigma-70 family RNA polymerase sigma factor [Aeromicrobium erythreum]